MGGSRDSSKDLSLIQKSLAKNFADHFKNACNQIKNMRSSQQRELSSEGNDTDGPSNILHANQSIVSNNTTTLGMLLRQNNEPQLIHRKSFESVNESMANLNPCLESQNSGSYVM